MTLALPSKMIVPACIITGIGGALCMLSLCIDSDALRAVGGLMAAIGAMNVCFAVVGVAQDVIAAQAERLQRYEQARYIFLETGNGQHEVWALVSDVEPDIKINMTRDEWQARQSAREEEYQQASMN